MLLPQKGTNQYTNVLIETCSKGKKLVHLILIITVAMQYNKKLDQLFCQMNKLGIQQIQ